jgi:hypothetical protein
MSGLTLHSRKQPVLAQSRKDVLNAECKTFAGWPRIPRFEGKVVSSSVHCVVSTKGRGNQRSSMNRSSTLLKTGEAVVAIAVLPSHVASSRCRQDIAHNPRRSKRCRAPTL